MSDPTYKELPLIIAGQIETVATVLALPATGVIAGATRYVQATESLYTWNGTIWTEVAGGGGGGAVDSVNGQTGVVVLELSDLISSPIALSDNGNTPPTDLNELTVTLTAAASATVANIDSIGSQVFGSIVVGDGAALTSGDYQVGAAIAGVTLSVSVGAGASIDNITAQPILCYVDPGSAGGSVHQLTMSDIVIPSSGGSLFVDRFYGYSLRQLSGNLAADNWGFHIDGNVDNWLRNSLKIGGTSGAGDTVTNLSVGLELESRALLLARLDEATRDTLTPVDGMMIFNTDTGSFQGYASGSWQNLN